MATSLSAGHCVASAASSCWLAKESKGVVVVAAASRVVKESSDSGVEFKQAAESVATANGPALVT
jgi:hypothetical protein